MKVTVVSTKQPDVQLTLSFDEIVTLGALFDHIGGNPDNTRRGTTERLRLLLADALSGTTYREDVAAVSDTEISSDAKILYFTTRKL